MWLSVIGYSVSPAERVLQDEVPYRDFLYNYTPGMLWLNALLMKFFGPTIAVVRAGLFVFKLATLLVLLNLARRLIGGWAALLPVALALGWLGYKYIFGVFPTQYSMLFVLTALLFMLKHDETEKLRWLILSGLSAGMVFVFKYNVGVLLFASGTTALFIREAILSGAQDAGTKMSKRILSLLIRTAKRASAYWAGFAAVVLAMAAYLAYDHALWAMIDHFLHHATAYSGERGVPLPSVKLLAPVALGTGLAVAGAFIILRKAPRWFEAYLTSLIALASIALLIPVRAYFIKVSASATVAYMPLILFVIAAGLVVWQLKSVRASEEQKRLWWSRNGKIVILALFAAGAYGEVFPRADYYHLVRVLPPIFLLLVAMIARALPGLRDYFQNHLPSPLRAAIFCAAVPLAMLLVVAIKDVWQPNFNSKFEFLDRVPLSIERAQGIMVRPKQAELIEGLVRLIEENSSQGDEIFSFAQRGAGFYFLTGRSNPTRFVWWRSVGLKKEDRAAVLEMIAHQRPRLILLQDAFKDRRVRDQITSGYDRIGASHDIGVYARKGAL